MLYYVSSFQGKVRPRGKFFSVEHRTKDNTRNPFPLQLCGWATNTLQYIMLGPLVTADRQQPSWLLLAKKLFYNILKTIENYILNILMTHKLTF